MNVSEVVSSLKNLPPAPRVMPILLKSLNDMNTSAEDIVKLLELDAGIVAKIIGVSNSAFYGGQGHVSDIGEAVGRLGFKEIYRIVTSIYAKVFVGNPMNSYQVEADERWFNSVGTGIVMEILCKKLGNGDPATTYTVGLLHDIGKTAIDEVFHHQYSTVLSTISTQQITLQKAEQQVFGFDHAQVGAALLKSWDFPEEIVEPIEFQFDPEHASKFRKEACMLHLSRWVCASIGGAPGTHAWAFELREPVFEILNCAPDIAMELILDSKEELMRREDLLKL